MLIIFKNCKRLFFLKNKIKIIEIISKIELIIWLIGKKKLITNIENPKKIYPINILSKISILFFDENKKCIKKLPNV
jgi:hypothetical protein